MTDRERSYLVNRILTGVIKLDFAEIRPPTITTKFRAEEIYSQTYSDCIFDGLLTSDEVVGMLVEKNYWTEKDEETLETLGRDIDTLKIELCKNVFRSDLRKKARLLLGKARQEKDRLSLKRARYDFLSAESIAEIAKTRFLVGDSLYVKNKKYWKSDRSWYRPDPIIDGVLHDFSRSLLTEHQFRLLARTDPWSSIWSARKACSGSVFGKSVAELTKEQETIILWASIYDVVRESSDCPEEEVIEDDDMLDGWFLIQKEKRKSAILGNKADGIGKSGADEVYIPVGSIEDARKVDSLNNPVSAGIKKMRFAYLKKHGIVNEVHMPDTKQKITMQMNRLYGESVKGGSGG